VKQHLMGVGRRGLVVLRPLPDALLAGSARGGELVEIGTVRLMGPDLRSSCCATWSWWVVVH
jgi:hypothetical protein